MYLDQEKGWTLLNRGKVIGAINFNLQKLIQGVANIDCSDLYMELNYVEQQLKKYKNMLSFANYKQKMNDITQIYDYNSDADKIESEILTLEAERTPLEIEYKRLNSVLQKNISFKKYITSMKLYVQDENGKQIPVNENTICGFKDNINYISTKIKIINNEILKLNKKIEKNEKSQNKANALFQTDTESMIKTFESDISRIHIDYASVHNMIKLLEGKQQQLKDCIDEETKSNHCIIAALHELISQYTKELGLDEKYVSPSRDYIFTSDLKSLSGAIFHKIVFSFKLAYVAIIEKYSNINLPIILDSPRGKEVDEINIKKMIDILKRDFSHHQIIIASIYKYNIEPLNVIQLKKYLLEFN